MKTPRCLSRLVHFSVVAGICWLGGCETSLAADRTWFGGGSDGKWSDPANWSSTPKTNGVDYLRFADAPVTETWNDFEDAAFLGIIYREAAPTFILNGNGIVLEGNYGIRNNSSSHQIINIGIQVTSSTTYLQAGSGQLTFNGVISGTGSLSFQGSNHAVNLNGANTISGGITLSTNLTLRLGHSQAAGTGVFQMSGGTLIFGGGITHFSMGGISGSGPFALEDENGNGVFLTLVGSGSYSKGGALSGKGGLIVNLAPEGYQALTGANTFTGGVTLNSGTLDINGGSAALSASTALTVNGGSLLITRGNNRTITVAEFNGTGGELVANTASDDTKYLATLVVNTTTENRYEGNIRDGVGIFAITKSGTGSLTLSGSNTYTGATTVNAGTLRIEGQLTNSNVSVAAEGTLGGDGGRIGGSLTMANNSAFEFTLGNSAEAGLSIHELSLGSNVNLKLALGRTVSGGEVFTLIETDLEILGTIARINGSTYTIGDSFYLEYLGQQYELKLVATDTSYSVVVIPEPGAQMLIGLAAAGMLALRRRRFHVSL